MAPLIDTDHCATTHKKKNAFRMRGAQVGSKCGGSSPKWDRMWRWRCAPTDDNRVRDRKKKRYPTEHIDARAIKHERGLAPRRKHIMCRHRTTTLGSTKLRQMSASSGAAPSRPSKRSSSHAIR